MKSTHYQSKSVNYGIGHTRLKRVLSLVGNIKNERVLDVGCARGYLGKKIKDLGNYVAGIEVSEEAAQVATLVLDRVYTFNIEGPLPTDIRNEKFDLIIMGEILEHVFDPIEVLKNIKEISADEGEIVITTPNLLMWTRRAGFLFGKFHYESEGVFDFGHIRFFTYRYLKEVILGSGFSITKENHIIFPGKLTEILKYWPSLFAHQFVVKVKKLK